MSRFTAQLSRDPDGYEWKQAKGIGFDSGKPRPENLVLVPKGLPDLERRHEEGEPVEYPNCYDPFAKEPALFRIYAALDGSPESIVSFATEYGDDAVFQMLDVGFGQTLADWRERIELLKDLLDESEQLLGRRVPLKERPNHERAIKDLVDRVLHDVPTYLSTDTTTGPIRLQIHTVELFDVVRLQLAESIIDRKQYRTCEQCAKPFEVSPQVNRSDRVYCSDNCRVKAYQRRRKQAIAMRDKGETLREIAKKLSSDVPTVKKWVGEAKKEE